MLRRRADLAACADRPKELRVTLRPQGAPAARLAAGGEDFALWLHPQGDRAALAALDEALAGPAGPIPSSSGAG
jgi:hypothetical protein